MTTPTQSSLVLAKELFDGVIFDLDGVVTRTARVHAAAWKQLFDEYREERLRKNLPAYPPFDTDHDYRLYVDGKPRYDGIQSFLDARGIKVPYGQPDDPPEEDSVCGLGNRKNLLFQQHLEREGLQVYESTIRLIRGLREHGFKVAIISASENCSAVLETAQIKDLFHAQVDGLVATELQLKGKPAPDVFLEAARRLGANPARSVVVEDAVAGVEAGRRGGFGLVIGVDRTGKALQNAYVYDGVYSIHRRRHHGRPPTGLDGYRFLGYAQTHDQVGNRARGERLSQLVSLSRLKIAAALVFTSPFVPMLFQGEEWGASTPFQYFTDHAEPELAKAVREGRRREFIAFGWKPDEVPDPQARETFVRSKLNWSELKGEPHATLLDWHRRLIQLRRDEPALGDGRLNLVQPRFDNSAGWFVLERGPITVACNLANQTQRLPLRAGKHTILLESDREMKLAGGGLNMPQDAVAILKHESQPPAS